MISFCLSSTDLQPHESRARSSGDFEEEGRALRGDVAAPPKWLRLPGEPAAVSRKDELGRPNTKRSRQQRDIIIFEMGIRLTVDLLSL